MRTRSREVAGGAGEAWYIERMPGPRISVVLVVGGVILASAVGAYYFFAVFSKQELLKQARTQVETWEKHWQEARQCMIGKQPLADTFAHSLLARELSMGNAQEALADCTKPMGQLTRPPGNNTGMDGVEEAWQAVDKLAIEAAQAYVIHLREPLNDGKLPAAMEALAGARASLRRQVKLSPEDTAMGPAPHALAMQPLEVQGQPLTELVLLPSTEGLLGFARAGERGHMVRLRRVDSAVKVVEAKASALEVSPVLPELSWGAGEEREGAGDADKVEILAGPLDGEGRVALATAKVVAKGVGLAARAAVGASLARAVVYVDETRTHVALSQDGGATWKSQVLAPTRDAVQVLFGEGYADVIWGASHEEGAPSSQVSWTRLEAARLPALPEAKAAVTLPNAIQRHVCPARVAPWALLRTSTAPAAPTAAGEDEDEAEGGDLKPFLVHLRDPQKSIALEDEEISEIVDCDDEAALLANTHEHALWMCKKSGECKRLPWRARSGLGVIVAGVPLVVTSEHQLAALLPQEGAPRFVKLPEGTALHGLYALDGEPYLAVRKQSGELLVGSLAAAAAAP